MSYIAADRQPCAYGAGIQGDIIPGYCIVKPISKIPKKELVVLVTHMVNDVTDNDGSNLGYLTVDMNTWKKPE